MPECSHISLIPDRTRLFRVAIVTAVGLCGCEGAQSALDPAGREAEKIARLFWWMTGGAAIIWLTVVGLAIYAIWLAPRQHDRRRARLFIVGGGVAFPTAVLSVLLIFGLRLLPELLAPAPEGSLHVEVDGVQWWWRVRYPADWLAGGTRPRLSDGEERGPVELANEIRLPIGEPVQLWLRSEDVIHAFWIPSLGGKVDMIPGRTTRLTLTPTRIGRFRGVCAEYCGAAHSQMAFDVVVMERDQFDEWLEHQLQPAREPEGELSRRGAGLFVSRGCGACHMIRGTGARGVVGPDLTHFGSRTTMGAGLLSNDIVSVHRWLSEIDRVKPGVEMPSFHMLPEEEHRALAAYLKGLE